MNNDSKEKILDAYNKLRGFGKYSFVNLGGFTIRHPDEKEKPAETDFNVVYGELEKYAKGHGEKAPKKSVNEAQDIKFRQQMKAFHKSFMNLWVRAKKLRKEKKA